MRARPAGLVCTGSWAARGFSGMQTACSCALIVMSTAFCMPERDYNDA